MNPPASSAAPPGVVHLGLGAFHRAHQALVFDQLLRAGDQRWGVFGVAMHNTALADALAAQGGRYAVQIASASRLQWVVPQALQATAVAAREPESVVRAIASPATRWITLTITEKGYATPLAQLLLRALGQRHAAARPGLTIASCDNLADNGHRLRALLLGQAQAQGWPTAFCHWLQEACAFPCSMVDRIVPAATPQLQQAAREAMAHRGEPLLVDSALATEAFWEWVIEDRFADPGDASALAAAGVTVVPDVRAFEEAKLRLLNGSHSALACIGTVAGLDHVSDCIVQPAIRRFVHGLMTREVGPHLARSDWPAYRDALLERFANPHLRHRTHQIANDSTQKIPQRWVPAATNRLRAGGSVKRLAFAAAAWMRHARGVDEQGREYPLSDPLADEVRTLARRHAGDADASFDALGRLPAVWGEELPRHAAWRAAVVHALEAIDQRGMLAALPCEDSE